MSGLSIDTAAWASPWRHRPVGDKLALSLGLTVTALVFPAWPVSPLVLVICVTAAVGPAGVPARVLARACRGPLAFILLAGPSLAITTAGGPGGLPLTVTRESLSAAAATIAHAVAGSSALLLLATTTPVSDLLGWLRHRGLPDVVPDVAGLVYRLLFVLLVTTRAVREAQAARLGYAGRAATIRSSALLAGAVLTRAWHRARRLEEGLTGRGLDGPLRVLGTRRSSSRRFLAATVALHGALIGAAALAASAPGTLR